MGAELELTATLEGGITGKLDAATLLTTGTLELDFVGSPLQAANKTAEEASSQWHPFF